MAACSSSSDKGSVAAAPAVVPTNANPGESAPSKVLPKDPETQLVIGVDAESWAAVGYQLTGLDVRATVDGLTLAQQTFDTEAGPLFPREVRLVAPKDKPYAIVNIAVDLRMNDVVVGQRRMTVSFVKGTTKLAYVLLEVRCNIFALGGGGTPQGPFCNTPGQTCIAGKCTSDAVGNPPDYRADWATNPPSECGSGAVEIAIGKGETDYAAVVDGETLPVDCGPQGGSHVWLALRMKSLRQVGTITTITAVQPGDAGGAAVPATGFTSSWAPAAGGACELAGLRFQLDVSGTPVADFLGKPLDITVNAKDKGGHDITTVAHVNVAPTRTGMYCF